jgi:ubiquinone biosynthesis protein COQ4
MASRGVTPRSLDPMAAIRAVRALVANPDDTAQVFKVIRALTGNSFERLYQRVLEDPAGRAILDEKRDILTVLKDRARLREMADGTLGREYARFLDTEYIDAEGLVEASDEIDDPSIFLDERAHVLSRRLRDSHDLWHVVTGYKRDIFGEVALLSFTYRQTGNHGIGFIVFIASLRLWHEGHREALQLIWNAWWRSRRAAFFPAADWEAMLEIPLAEVRRLLEVGETPVYKPMFSAAVASAH